MNESQVFDNALKLATPAQRAAYLDEACAGNPQLRADVEALLQAYANDPAFLEQPAGSLGGTVDGPRAAASPGAPAATPDGAEQPGVVLAGRYKLLEAVGEGGMGSVWMAQQTEPVKRLVALKRIKAGMDSKQVLARFEAERQALALMDHPNIAKVLDAGAGSDGRPFFVMELVKGIPITKYCDQHHLTPRQRLELFVPVCQAIQHAHHKGIIHRDVKPSNVLVARYDDRPVPKVIDFGVAKATGQQLTEQTLHTGFGAVVGTLEYMSPEQAGFNQLDVDTRSDIYSLGIILYELLAGSPPFSRKELEKAGVLEMLRVIREQEPSKPSTKLSTADGLPTLAANRGTEPGKLTRLMRGELDWIVMKALEKDRSRRYETANGFAMDVQRYLADEAVLACPPSASYRLRKFVRRNKGPVLAAGVVALALLAVLGTVAGSVGWVARDRQARRSAVAEEVERALAESARLQADGKLPEALGAARRAQGLLAGGADEAVRQRVQDRVADLELVATVEDIRLRLSASTNRKSDQRRMDRDYADAFGKFRLLDEGAEPAAAAEMLRATTVPVELALALDDWSFARRKAWGSRDAGWRRLLAVARAVDPDPWRYRLRDLQERLRALEDIDPAQKELGVTEKKALAASAPVEALSPVTLVALARSLAMSDAHDEAVVVLSKAQRRYPADFWINFELGNAFCFYSQPFRPEEAVRFFSVAVALRPQSTAAHNNLGIALAKKGQVEAAIAEYQEVLRLHPDDAEAHNNLGGALNDKGQVEAAIAEYQEALRLQPDLASAHNNLGVALAKQGQLDTAIAEFREGLRLGPDDASVHFHLGTALGRKGQLDASIAELQEVLRLRPDDAMAHLNLGLALNHKGQLDAGNAELKEALRLQPDLVLAHFNLGITLAKQGQLDAAIAEFREAVHLKPDDAMAHFNLGNVLARKGQLDAAIAEFLEATRVQPDLVMAHKNLGLTLARQGRLEEAMAARREVVRLQPDSAKAHNDLAWELATCADPKLRDPQEAVALAMRATEIEPQNGSNWNTLGVAHYRTRDWNAAIAALEKSMALSKGGNSFDWFFLAMAYWQAGEKGRAKVWYERAAQWMEKNQPNDARLRRLRAEAAELLGVTQKKD